MTLFNRSVLVQAASFYTTVTFGRDAMCKYNVLTLFLVFVILSTPAYSSAESEKRIALVIGNGDYKIAPLRNAVNDAVDMAENLSKCGFTVVKVINASRQEMREAVREFGVQIMRGGVGLFFYAGHGLQVNGENYLVPIGANVAHENEVEDECLRVSSVLRKMESAQNRLNIIILDACRNNPFGRGYRSTDRGLARMDAPTGSILAYATAPGSTASDGDGRNGLYTSSLLKHILTPGLEIGKLFRQVRMDVLQSSSKKQIPWESSSLIGEFYFTTSSTTTAGGSPTPEKTSTGAKDLNRDFLPVNAKIAPLNFFESASQPPEKENRKYDKRFKKAETRFINWELCIELPSSLGRQIDYKIDEIYYGKDNSVIHRDSVTDFIPADWDHICQTHSSGWNEAGNWEVGRYTLKLFMNGREIGTGIFEVY